VSDTPRISIVIPIYNEQAILHAAVVDLRERLAPLGWAYEIILAENGSRDDTIMIATELSEKYPELRMLSVGEPNYGKALRQGIIAARGEFVLCDEIDLCDTEFYARALALLERTLYSDIWPASSTRTSCARCSGFAARTPMA
jgi:glycosyltransferase involved in cell wall biosynthesis